MSRRRVTLAFAGSGATTYENTRDLLCDFLRFGAEVDGEPTRDPNLDLGLYIPLTGRISEPLYTVFDWTGYTGVVYDLLLAPDFEAADADEEWVVSNADTKATVPNPDSEVITRLRQAKDEGCETYLVLLWGTEGDEQSETLLDLAESYDIPVLDLTAGLDDLAFADQSPEPEVSVRPEPVVSTPRPALKVAETPLEPDEEEAEEDDEEYTPLVPAWVELPVEEISQARVFTEPVPSRLGGVDPRDAVEAAAQALTEAISRYVPGESMKKFLAQSKVAEALMWSFAAISEGAPSEAPAPKPKKTPQKAQKAPSKGRGRPRADGSPAKPRSASQKAVVEVWDEVAQEWFRKGRGRIPKDAKTRMVDPSNGKVVQAS